MSRNIEASISTVNRSLYLKQNRFAYNFNAMKYGERLKMAREMAGLTQQELADRVGMKQPSLAYLENPTKNAKGSEFTVKISRALGVSVDWLDDEMGDMTPKRYSTSDPTLVKMLQALEPRAEYLKEAAYKAVMTTCDLVDQANSNRGDESTVDPIRKRVVNAHQRRREMDQQPIPSVIGKKRDAQ